MITGARVFLFITGYLLILFSLIPLIRHDNWAIRVFDYPRWQKLIINIILIAGFAIVFDVAVLHDKIFGVLLLLNSLYLFYQIWPYTSLSKRQMKNSKVHDQDRQIKVLISNIYQDQRNVDKCVAMVREHNPDLVLMVETNQWWVERLDRSLSDIYDHKVAVPLENTYGMVLFSRYQLLQPEVKYLIEQDIPSIHTRVKLPSGDIVQLFGLHPKPPVPHETARSTERDAEILLVAKEASKLKTPVIVAGDLNDVAWSYTTELFLKVSHLLDPRRGRGFYNTFHAHYWFLRWPLDHIFCSTHFQLLSLQRLPDIGSDHFPILVSLQLCPEDKKRNQKETLSADRSEKAMAEKKIRQAK